MKPFNVLLILITSSIALAYPAQDQFIQYIQPSEPSNYKFLVNQPYPAPYAFTYEQPQAAPITNYHELASIQKPPLSVQHRPKPPTLRYRKEEMQDVIEDVLKLLIDQRLCEISNAYRPITKRSVNPHFSARSASTETGPFTQQQLAFLNNLKPEEINELIKLLIPSQLALNRTLPIQQEVPHLLPPTFYMPTPIWHPAPLQVPELSASPYIQDQLIPFSSYEHQFISYEPVQPAEDIPFQIIKPYMESPMAPSVVLNRLPPLPSPFVYSVQISAPLHNNQAATKPQTVVPNYQIISKPLPTVPSSQIVSKPTKVEVVTSNPQALSLGEKLQSIFSQSRILLDQETTTKEQVTSTEKSQTDLVTVPPNKVENVSKVSVENPDSKLKDDSVKKTARSADPAEVRAFHVAENEQLLEAFKAIRENLMKNNACKITPRRRAISEEPDVDFVRNQIYQDYLSRHAIPPASLPSRRHPPAKITHHKYTPHTPFHANTWQRQ